MRFLSIIIFFLINTAIYWAPHSHASNNSKIHVEIDSLIKAGISLQKTNSDSAILTFKNAMKLSSEQKYKKGYIESGFSLVKIYKNKGFFQDAVKTLDYLQHYAKANNDNDLNAVCFYNLGEVYRASMNSGLSFKNLFCALSIFRIEKNEEYLAKCYNRIAAAYFEAKKFDLSKQYADSSNTIALKSNNYSLIYSNEEIIGGVMRRTNRHSEAIERLKFAQKYMYLSGDTTDLPNLLNNFAYTYLEMGEYKEAINYASKSYAISKEKDILVYTSNAAQILSYCYSATDDIITAFDYLRIRDSLVYKNLVEDRNRLIMDLNEKIDKERKEKQFALLKKQDELKGITIKNQKTSFLLLIIILLIVLISGFVIFIERQKLKQANKLLKLQKKEIEQQNIKITEAYSKLKDLEIFKEKMIGMIVHDLKNPLNNIINIPSMYIGEKRNEYVKEVGYLMLNLVSNILDVQKYENTKMPLLKEDFNIFSDVKILIEQIKLLAEQKNIQFDLQINSNLFANGDKEIFKRVVINLLTNSIKYSPNNSTIKIIAEKIEEKVKIMIKDSGNIIPYELRNSLFTIYGQIEPKNSGIVKSTGLGLAFCKLAVTEHGCEIGYFSENEQRNVFWFDFPCQVKKDNLFPPPIKNNKTEFQLSDDDYKYLSKYIIELQSVKFYEASKIKKILSEINPPENSNIKMWCEKIYNSIYTFNEKQYHELIKISQNK